MVQSKESLYNEKVLEKLCDNRILADTSQSSASAVESSKIIVPELSKLTAKKEIIPVAEENPNEDQKIVFETRVSLEKFLKDCVQRVHL